MKKKSLISCFVILMSFIMTSCNNDDLIENSQTFTKNSDTVERSYLFAVKTSKRSETNTRAVGVDTIKYWEPGTFIRVKFLNGTPLAQSRVQEYAKIWEKYAYITFQFVSSNEEADVKIEFGNNNSDLSWSVIGTDCSDYEQDLASMGLIKFSDAELDDKTNNGDAREDFRAIVLREFGHVLGLGFEHQNPNSDFAQNLDYDKAEAYLIRQGWSDYEIADMLETYSGRRVDAGTFDENSIMMLYFPAYLTLDGKEGKWNSFLSEGDISFIRKVYPFPKVDIDITFAANNYSTTHKYQAVRIGEYLWLDCNMYNPYGRTPSRSALDNALKRLNSDPSSYPVSMSDFNRYYGSYYDRYPWGWSIDNALSYPTVYEYNQNGAKSKTDWRLPTQGDFEQLFGMCGDASDVSVKRYLGCKINDNPCAYNPSNINWFSGNENIYGFNMMPGANLFNGPQFDEYERTEGDFGDPFKAERFVGHNQTIVISTYGHGRFTIMLYHFMHVRYCRQLTDQELGYKLYINSSKTDILKKGLGEAAPAGYTEMPHNYLRGFYVQYILDNPYPKKTIAQIVQMANSAKR